VNCNVTFSYTPAAEDRDHLDRGQPALRTDGRRELRERQRLLGYVVAEIRCDGLRRPRVLVDYHFMSCHFRFPFVFLAWWFVGGWFVGLAENSFIGTFISP